MKMKMWKNRNGGEKNRKWKGGWKKKRNRVWNGKNRIWKGRWKKKEMMRKEKSCEIQNYFSQPQMKKMKKKKKKKKRDLMA